MTKKGSGQWGVSVVDSAYVENGSNPIACSGPPSACNAYVTKKILRSNLSTSDAYGSASTKSVTALGTLLADGKARSSGKGQQSSGSGDGIGWEDTFTVTSKTLPPGTYVSLTATLEVTGNRFECTSSGGATLTVASLYSGLSYEEYCASSPAPVLTSTFTSTVGSSFTDGVGLILTVDAGTEYGAGKFAAGPFTATYHLDSNTPGAKYITASGKSYT